MEKEGLSQILVSPIDQELLSEFLYGYSELLQINQSIKGNLSDFPTLISGFEKIWNCTPLITSPDTFISPFSEFRDHFITLKSQHEDLQTERST